VEIQLKINSNSNNKKFKKNSRKKNRKSNWKINENQQIIQAKWIENPIKNAINWDKWNKRKINERSYKNWI
jgi:hypothetical protein